MTVTCQQKSLGVSPRLLKTTTTRDAELLRDGQLNICLLF